MIHDLQKHKVIYIIRNPSIEYSEAAILSVWKAGGRFVEITLNSNGALEILRRLANKVPSGCYLGAGTVKSPEEAEEAGKTGISYIVTPVGSKELVDKIKSLKLYSIIGAMTSTEVYNAWNWGADLVKVFPAGSPEYIKTLQGPFDFIPLVAVGGVKKDNILDFIKAGSTAVALGASFFNFKPDGSFDAAAVEKNIREICRIYE